MPARTRATVPRRPPARTGRPTRRQPAGRRAARTPSPARAARDPEPEPEPASHPSLARRTDHGAGGAAGPRRGDRLAVQVPRPGPAVVTGVMPGSFTGYAFDTCEAPSQRQMDAWHEHSPYAAVGVYIAGENRACPRQRHLDAAWVAAQAARGWRLLPLSVGPQAPCSEGTRWSKSRPSPAPRVRRGPGPGPRRRPPTQRRPRGTWASPGAARCGSTWSRSTSPAPGAATRRWPTCRRGRGRCAAAGTGRASTPAPPPASGCSSRHAWPPRAGMTSRTRSGSATGTIATTPGRRTWPATGGRAGGSTSTAGTHPETYGGVTLRVDSNFMDVGQGTVAPPDRTPCPSASGLPDAPGRRPVPGASRCSSASWGAASVRQRHLARYWSGTARDVTASSGLPGFRRPGWSTGRPGWRCSAGARAPAEVRVCRRRRTAPAARARRGRERGGLRDRGVRGRTRAAVVATSTRTTSRPRAW